MAKARANARPTKSLILDALTTDIDLGDAILDLLDNSIDGIRRVDKTNPKWDRYSITINFDKKHFEIIDNCGGMDAVTARDYAFRFGRPSDRAPEQGVLGIYGVGMKRAIFKMGEKFDVTSKTRKTSFKISENLKTWKEDEDLWHFDFDEFDTSASNDQSKVGTQIHISALFEGVSQEFQNPQFTSELIKKSAKAHRVGLEKGLCVRINETPLQTAAFTLLRSEAIHPAHSKLEHNGSGSPVAVKLFAGISESSPTEAGWYVFCNGRMVLEADQTPRTVWGETGEISIPKIHNQFSRFRGYAFFDCDDQKRLPWTSTKSGIDQSSQIYRRTRRNMVETTRPVISFLNALDAEKDAESRPRHDAIKLAKPVALSDLTGANVQFRYDGHKAIGPEIVRISFQRPKTKVQAVKDRLEVTSNKEVGEAVFDYYYRYEIGKK